MILVLGAGVAGLAAAETLQRLGRDFTVLEREGEAGGWCRSTTRFGYRFDMSGHFVHTADPAVRADLEALPGVDWRDVVRQASVRLGGVVTPFPFQSNLAGHDPDLVARCLEGFAAERIREATGRSAPPSHFGDWLARRFGGAMCRAFFYPYNRKLWRRPLSSMTFEWTDWAVPVPSFDEVLAGARGAGRRDAGYNATFLYPGRGGIGALPRAMASRIPGRVRTGCEAVSIDLRRRVAETASGESIRFEAAVSTIPLPDLVARSHGVPAGVVEAGKGLEWVKILALNAGIRNPGPFRGHWQYVPEQAFPFFRAGCLSNVAPSSAPKGCASVFAEKAFPARARIDREKEATSLLEGLSRAGVIAPESAVEAVETVLLDPGYVVFDRHRAAELPRIRGHFARRGIFTAGRYGAWDYFGIEKSIVDGRRAAIEAAAFRA